MRVLAAGCLLVAAAILIPASAKGPAKVDEVAPAADLDAEAAAQLELLGRYLADEKAWEENRKKQIPRAAGVLAVLGQAAAEHSGKAKLSGADVRDAAIAVYKAKNLAGAKAAFADLQAAVGGKAGSAKTAHPWNKLINLHRLMEEVNARNSKLRRAVRRISDPAADARHASTLALLAIVIEADTHEVKDKAHLPKWVQHSQDFRAAMIEAATAIRKNDGDAAKRAYLKGTRSCAKCHADFRE